MVEATLRIGELSRRAGVSPELLRAWERRYQLLRPSRTPGGYRLYTEADVARVARMRQLLEEGLAASEAARLAGQLDAEPTPARGAAGADHRFGSALRALTSAMEGFDEAGAHRVIDDALAAYQLETVLSGLVLPYLHDLGQRWEDGQVSVAQEHFASQLLRGRLLGLARGWGAGGGPRALLACPPRELHDLPLILFGLALRGQGWRITFLGADTPVSTLEQAAERLRPALVVVAAADPQRFTDAAEALAGIAARWPLAIAGRGATTEVAGGIAARHLDTDPVQSAQAIAGEVLRLPGGR